jgi:hypothetical protein
MVNAFVPSVVIERLGNEQSVCTHSENGYGPG